MYGSPETTTGGNALKYYASIRLDIRRTETLKKDDKEIGNRVKVKVVKNKVAPPFKSCSLELIYGKGLSKEGEILDLAVKYDIINKSGSWFSYNDEKLGQGRENIKQYLRENPNLLEEIHQKIKAIYLSE